MTPSFALDLSLDGIRLLFRADGGWTVVGDVALEDPALARRLARLRAEAHVLAGGPVATELVIPPSQIRYATVPKPAGTATAATLAPAIAGLTPLDLSELAFDWEIEDEEVRVALVDRQTLDEAETFAAAHGFKPLRFSARPTPAQFPRAPDFGPARDSAVPPVAAEAPVAPRPHATAPAVGPDAEGAAVLARSLSAPRPGDGPPLRARPRLRPLPALALGAGGIAAAALALVLSLGPAADLVPDIPDTPPEIALALPALASPEAVEAAPAAPVPDDPAVASVETAAVPPPAPGREPSADTAAPVALGLAAPAAVATAGPQRPAPPAPGTIETVYVASIDPATRASDAVALPSVASFASAPPPAISAPPSPAGPAPDGVAVAEGAVPPAEAPATAEAAETVEPTTPALSELALSVPERRPLARPAGLAERTERAVFAGRTRAEMAALRPAPRPVSAQAAASTAPPSDQAVARSLRPNDRPADFATRVATAQAVAAALAAPPPAPPPAAAPEPAPQVAAAAPPPPPAAPAPEETYDDGETDVVAAAPNIPTSASVARQATIRNAISLREINLIGVFGTERDRRALVRLPSGRLVRVQVGDRLDGGQIAAIGRDELRYVKGGRNITLSVPSG